MDIRLRNCFSLGVECFFKFSTTHSNELAYFWWQIAHVGIILTPVGYYHFVYVLLKLDKSYQKLFLLCAYLLAIFFIFFNFLPQKIFVGELKFVFNQYYSHNWTILKNPIYLVFYLLFYWILLLYSFLLVINCYISSRALLETS